MAPCELLIQNEVLIQVALHVFCVIIIFFKIFPLSTIFPPNTFDVCSARKLLHGYVLYDVYLCVHYVDFVLVYFFSYIFTSALGKYKYLKKNPFIIF